MTNQIIHRLDSLDNVRARMDVLQLKKKELIEKAIPPEVQEEIDDIEFEFEVGIQSTQEVINELEGEIKALCVQAGKSVKGEFLQVVRYKGRVTWDNKGLLSLEKGNPEIWNIVKNFMNVGNPSAQIRTLKK